MATKFRWSNLALKYWAIFGKNCMGHDQGTVCSEVIWQPKFGHVDLSWQVFGLFPKPWQDTVHVANVGLQTNIP